MAFALSDKLISENTLAERATSIPFAPPINALGVEDVSKIAWQYDYHLACLEALNANGTGMCRVSEQLCIVAELQLA